MAIDDTGVSVVRVGELLHEDLFIPPYQRPYSWEPATALQLLDDIEEAWLAGQVATKEEPENKSAYVLGAVILHRDRATNELNVVDGQQRLLTLLMILDVLDASEAHGSHEVPSGREDGVALIVRVRRSLAGRVRDWASDPERSAQLADFVRQRCELIRVETDDADEAFRVFDSQNYRGKALRPHDLLKAFHLREMHGESDAMKLALVETWESTPDADLDRLFSTYLWRIRQWSRGLSAPPFSTRDVDVFKGVTRRAPVTPMAHYHFAAQAVLPLLASWNSHPGDDERTQSRSRFQVDAPIQAGRFFFEMVTFMLAELKELRREAYAEGEWKTFASTDDDLRELSFRSHYRYVSELYLAALLYYTNKFGDADLPRAKRRLMRWSYSLRTQLQRVQYASINNHAKQSAPAPSAFVLMRGADKPADLRSLTTGSQGNEQNSDHMRELRALLMDLDV